MAAEAVGLGQVNIGIFNTEPQPRRSPEHDLALVFAGEFYHHDRYRQTLVHEGEIEPDAPDSDLALATYLRDGVDGLTRLDGMFTVAIWDARRRELIVINDRLGLYPHYYAHQGGRFALAPELKALVAAGAAQDLDLTAVAEYIRFQQLLGDRTWLEGVRLLPPGSVLRYQPDQDRLTIESYWGFEDIVPVESITLNDAVDETIRLFERSIGARSKPPHRIGIYLSGGRDSRTVLGFLERNSGIKTFNYGAPNSRDVIYARRIAERAGSEHRWFDLSDGHWVREHADLHLRLTEGMHSWLHMHGISTIETARQLVDVNLSGWVGGTVFGSYSGRNAERTQALMAPPDLETAYQRYFEAACYIATWPGLNEPEALALSRGSGRNYSALAFESLRANFDRSLGIHPAVLLRALAIYHHDLRSTINMTVFTRAAIEVRSPYMDVDLLTFVLSLPDEIRQGNDFYREIIRRRLPDLGAVPYDHDDIPPIASDRQRLVHKGLAKSKRSMRWVARRPPVDRVWLYADYEEYLRTDLRAWAESILFDQRTLERGLFNQQAVQSLWNRHLSGQELWTVGKIAPLIEIERVARLLVDGEPAASSPELERVASSA